MTASLITTAGDVLDALGGTFAVARGLSILPPRVSNWRERGIPPGQWPALVRFAADIGRSDVTFEVLAALAEPVEARA